MTVEKVSQEEMHSQFKERYQKLIEENQQLSAKIKENALRIHNALGCRHYSRVDFILCEETGNPYMLEVNTLPGMSKTSLLPMSAKSKDISFKRLVKTIVKEAIKDL